MCSTDTLGTTGVFRDPMWRVSVALTPLEQDLLRCWWVRRLGFIAHAGAAAITTTQSYSRLEHSLGLLTLVAHFDPSDRVARAAALLHDIGHLPFSHTFEGVAGLDHHRIGADRIKELGPVLRSHGVEASAVTDVEGGRRPSVLHGPAGALTLDHLESFVRSARSHGRTREPPPATLARLRVADGAVGTDAKTGAYLVDLIIDEARSQSSAPNVVATGLMRHLATQALADLPHAGLMRVAAMTDDEFWAMLLRNPRTATLAEEFRRDPAAWTVTDCPTNQAGASEAVDPRAITYAVTRQYLDLPVVDGKLISVDPAAADRLPRSPRRWSISRG